MAYVFDQFDEMPSGARPGPLDDLLGPIGAANQLGRQSGPLDDLLGPVNGSAAKTATGNIFDQFDTPSTSAAAPAGGNVFDQFDIDDPRMTVETPGMLQSFLRGAGTGATFGFDDELGLQDKTKREAARKANPWTFFAGEMAGGVLPMVAGAPVAGAIKGVGTGARVVRGAVNLLVPKASTAAAGAVGQAVKTGVTYGALSGAGNADPENTTGTLDALGERLKGAGSGGVVAGLFAGPLGLAGHGVSRVAQHIGGARAAGGLETDDAHQGAVMAIARGLERDRIDPNKITSQIRDEFTGGRGKPRRVGRAQAQQAWTDEMMEQVARESAAGAPTKRIAANLGGVPESAVRTVLRDMEQGSRGPLNITDRAGMVKVGSGDNTQMTLRAAAATPGEARGVAREALLERQIGAHSRLGSAFDRIVGLRDYDGVAAQHRDALEDAAKYAYGFAYRNEMPFNLQPIFDRWTRQFDGKRGPVPESVSKGVDSMLRKVPVRNQVTGATVTENLVPPRNLQEFIDARQNLTAAIDKAQREYGKNSAVTRALVGLRDELSLEVRKTNPLWGIADDIWSDGMAAESALEAGARMSTRLNARSREGLEEWTKARKALAEAKKNGDPQREAGAKARMELFKVGLVRALNDELANAGATHDLTRALRTPAAKQTLVELLGKKKTDELYRVVDAEHAMLRTYGSQFGSQTTPLKEAIADLDWAPKMSAALDLRHPLKILEHGAEWLSRRYNEGRNARMMPMLTEQDPVRQLEILRAVRGVTQARSNWGTNTSYVPRGMIGPAAGATISENSANWREQERRRQVIRGMIGPLEGASR